MASPIKEKKVEPAIPVTKSSELNQYLGFLGKNQAYSAVQLKAVATVGEKVLGMGIESAPGYLGSTKPLDRVKELVGDKSKISPGTYTTLKTLSYADQLKKALPALGYVQDNSDKGFVTHSDPDNAKRTVFLIYPDKNGSQVASKAKAKAEQSVATTTEKVKEQPRAAAPTAKEAAPEEQPEQRKATKLEEPETVERNRPVESPVQVNMQSVSERLAKIQSANPNLAKLTESQEITLTSLLYQLSDSPAELKALMNALQNKTELPKMQILFNGTDVANMTAIFAANGCLFNFTPVTAADPIYKFISEMKNMPDANEKQSYGGGQFSELTYLQAYDNLSSSDMNMRFEALRVTKGWLNRPHAVDIATSKGETTALNAAELKKGAKEVIGETPVAGVATVSPVFVGSATYEKDGYAFGKDVPVTDWQTASESIKNAVVNSDQDKLKNIQLLPKPSKEKIAPQYEIKIKGDDAIIANVFTSEKKGKVTFVLYSNAGINSMAEKLNLDPKTVQSTVDKGSAKTMVTQWEQMEKLVNKQKATEIILNAPDVNKWEAAGFKTSTIWKLRATWTVTPPGEKSPAETKPALLATKLNELPVGVADGLEVISKRSNADAEKVKKEVLDKIVNETPDTAAELPATSRFKLPSKSQLYTLVTNEANKDFNKESIAELLPNALVQKYYKENVSSDQFAVSFDEKGTSISLVISYNKSATTAGVKAKPAEKKAEPKQEIIPEKEQPKPVVETKAKEGLVLPAVKESNTGLVEAKRFLTEDVALSKEKMDFFTDNSIAFGSKAHVGKYDSFMTKQDVELLKTNLPPVILEKIKGRGGKALSESGWAEKGGVLSDEWTFTANNEKLSLRLSVSAPNEKGSRTVKLGLKK